MDIKNVKIKLDKYFYILFFIPMILIFRFQYLKVLADSMVDRTGGGIGFPMVFSISCGRIGSCPPFDYFALIINLIFFFVVAVILRTLISLFYNKIKNKS
jgi:hypothetical protein